MILCGIDEAGRGPLAGPVTAAAVILPEDFPTEDLNDSKKLTETKRMDIIKQMLLSKVPIGIGWVWPFEIDRFNIHHSSLLAMKRAFFNLQGRQSVQIIYVDGKFKPFWHKQPETRAVIKGDSKIPEIMAASIAAKTARDQWMIRSEWYSTDYGFARHKGYPTKSHIDKIRELGPGDLHRYSFRLDYD